MTRAATRRLGARLGARADGTPGRTPGGTLIARQGTVVAVAAGVVSVTTPEDPDSTPMGYLGLQPRVGDTVLWATLNTGPWVLGVQTPAEASPYLNRADSGSGSGTAGTGGAAVLTLNVTVPAGGWPAGTRVQVDGDVFVSTGSGIGSSVSMTGMSDPPPTRTVNQSASYDGHMVGYDLNPPAGTRTYTLTVASVTASQVATWRAPSLRATLLLPGRA